MLKSHHPHKHTISYPDPFSSPTDPCCLTGIIAPALHEGDTYAFTMCNPPFFGSIEEAGQNPATAFGGTREEMVCEGGEDAFLRTMVEESLLLRVRVLEGRGGCGLVWKWR